MATIGYPVNGCLRLMKGLCGLLRGGAGRTDGISFMKGTGAIKSGTTGELITGMATWEKVSAAANGATGGLRTTPQ